MTPLWQFLCERLSSFNLKGSSTHMHGLTVYVKDGLPFAWNLSLENSTVSELCFRLAILHSVSYFFFLLLITLFCLCAWFLILFHLTYRVVQKSTLFCFSFQSCVLQFFFHISQVVQTAGQCRRDFGRNNVPDRRSTQHLVVKSGETVNVADATQRPQWSTSFKSSKPNKLGSFSIL